MEEGGPGKLQSCCVVVFLPGLILSTRLFGGWGIFTAVCSGE